MKIFNRLFILNLVRILLFAICASLAWWGVTSLMMFIMFVPLLFIQRDKKGINVMWWWIAALILWNLSTIWWVWKAAPIGVAAATLTHTVLFSAVLALYNKSWRLSTLPLSYTLLIAGWVGAEWLYLNGEISFPWLNIGNGFGIEPYFVQWYEYTGTLGGTFWVLIVNLLIFEALKGVGKINIRSIVCRKMIMPLIIFSLPIIFSLVTYLTYKENGKTVKVAVIQPNIDPYNEKFGGMSPEEQENIIMDLASQASHDVSFFVAPETALDNDFWMESITTNPTVKRVRYFMKDYPNAEFIAGLTIYEKYLKIPGKKPPTVTARTNMRLPFYYDIYNSAIKIDTCDSVGIYHKSRLTIGVEMLPYYRYLSFISDLSVNLGGISGMLGSQAEREVFKNSSNNVNIGSAICYESVYGEFFTEFVRKGADLMFVITNDGWWGNTPGYMQHLSYSSLRAIESRRNIARSANTGISALIDSRGKIYSRTSWDERTLLQGEVTTNDKLTFYVVYGDMIGRLCGYTFVLTLLYFIAYRYKKRSHLN
ncbi:MAG: apolipoprotein N-acyltransferase [Rikenellaceae bacterium]